MLTNETLILTFKCVTLLIIVFTRYRSNSTYYSIMENGEAKENRLKHIAICCSLWLYVDVLTKCFGVLHEVVNIHIVKSIMLLLIIPHPNPMFHSRVWISLSVKSDNNHSLLLLVRYVSATPCTCRHTPKMYTSFMVLLVNVQIRVS